MSANPLLSIEGLTASVDEKTILHNVNLVAAGETHVLMGPNGAGKSTLGHLVMGDPVYTVNDGRIVFDGQGHHRAHHRQALARRPVPIFQAPVEIPGVPLSSFLRASIAGRPGLEMKGKEFRRRVKELAAELNMDTAYLNRELGVGFSGGEKKKVEMLQLLLLQPKLAILDETDSGLDVDALSTVSHGMDAYRKSCDGSMLIITHNTRILEHLDVDRAHVMVKGHIVREDDAPAHPLIDKNGFETFEREAAEQRARGRGRRCRAAGARGDAMTKNRTEVADIDRSLYDFTYGEEGFERLDAGITPDIVREISAKKDEPEWMLELRLKSLEIFNRFPDPRGALHRGSGHGQHRHLRQTEHRPKNDWESVPDDIKNTFERLGIPEAERSYLAGVGAQYDSELVYHNMQDTASKMGIVYSGIEEALHNPQWEPLIHEKFMTLIPPTDHKFAALHGAVWSGGSFVYVPKGTKLDFPLQSYFRLNAKGAGQFEHTLIIVEDDADLHFIEGCSAPKYNVANLHAGAVELFVGKRAHLRYSTIENWSKNMYNLNTKRARVDEDGDIEWVSGSFGSHVGYLYPMSVLKGRRARSSFTGITFAGAGQNLDTGCKVVLNAPETSATVETKGISKSGGIQTFRSSVVATPKAEGSKRSVSCQSLMLDDQSRSDTIPAMDIRAKNVDVGHEATIGRIGDDKVFYLMSRGISEEEARTMIVNGFADPVSKELPLEYAVEMNNLIKLEMEGAIG